MDEVSQGPVDTASTSPAAVPVDDFARLAEITARRRAEMGIGPNGRALPAAPTERSTGQAAVSGFGASIAPGGRRALPVRIVDPKEHEDLNAVPLPPWDPEARAFLGNGAYDCIDCDATIPGPGMCASCFSKWRERQKQETLEALLQDRLPEIHWDCSWESLPNLRDKGGVLRFPVDAEEAANLRTMFQPRQRIFIFGPAGEGKSTLAACWLREAIERGESAAFVLARDLQDDPDGRALCDRVAHVDRLVLDDLGGEAQGARIGGDVAAIRNKLTVQLLLHRFGHKRRTLMTFGRPIKYLTDLYDAGVVRRIREDALLIPIGSFD